MRKTIVVVGIIISALLFSSAALAAPLSVPINVRVVQQSNVDNNRVFSSVQQAIDSITNASVTNPYLVKVMPGIYNEAVTMKPFVSLVGQGQKETFINGGINGASDTEIRDLTVTAEVTGIYNFNAAPAIRNVTIIVTNGRKGIDNYINAAGVGNIEIENVKISIDSDDGAVLGISTIGTWNGSGYDTATSIVRNSSITIHAAGATDIYFIAGIYGNRYAGNIVDSTDIDITVDAGDSRYPIGVFAQSATISNSKIKVQGDSPNSTGVSIFGSWDVTTKIFNTYIDAPTAIVNMYSGYIKCVNAYDANLASACPAP